MKDDASGRDKQGSRVAFVARESKAGADPGPEGLLLQHPLEELDLVGEGVILA